MRSRRALITTTVAAAGIAIAGATANDASAVEAPANAKVQQVFCSAKKISVDLTYTNQYGNQESRSRVALKGKTRRGVTCITFTTRADSSYGDYISSNIIGNNGGYVYCAIWVNGTKVSQSRDNGEYLSSAFCY